MPTPHTFGHLSNYGSQLSADGAWVMRVQRNARKTSVIVSKADGSQASFAVRPEENLGVYFAAWAMDANRVIVSAGVPGSGVEALFSYDVATQRRVDLLEALKAPEVLYASASARDNLAYPIMMYRDKERPVQQSLFLVDFRAGVLKPVTPEQGVIPFTFGACPSQTFGLRLGDDGDAAKSTEEEGVGLFLKQQGAWRPLRHIDERARALGSALVSCSEAKHEIYFLDTESRDFLSLNTYDLDTLQSKQLSADRGDITSLLIDRSSGAVDSYSIDFDKPELRPVSSAAQQLAQRVGKNFPDGLALVSRSLDGKTYLLAGAMPGQIDGNYLWTDTRPDNLTLLYAARDDMTGWKLQEQHAQEIRARDGQMFTAYLTMPGEMCPPQGCKTVLLVHSGPGERNSVHADPEIQWLASLGYMVLSVNFRGSHGVGEQWEALGNRQWGAKMQDDLDDAVQWAIDYGLSDPKKIAVMGSGYGGFAALNAVLREGNSYACAVSMSGIADLPAFIAHRTRAMPESEADLHTRIGNPDNADEKRALSARSPIAHADKLKVPLLLTGVEKDSLVPLEETLAFNEQIAKSGGSGLVSLFAFKGAGHVFNSEKNEQLTWRLTARFLGHCLDDSASHGATEFDGADFYRREDGLHLLY